ncbi:hypothetical protein NDI76_16150 [Halogeometricum sp. S1BR25-6]|uniref:Uncharacterized protein n=1 Tax=Halogeometricum salsisoli TaxID=2950536 RepID=A0ABU2GJC5_9EURY|nr:hypothetical protein [Halogeometricum sp. S1BR25-6]MDS0300279.1 hypothetical protein [Halogeometricum sp. S1BR25-6]
MATTRRQRFVNGQIAVMLASIVGLSLIGAFSLGLFVLVSLIGFLLLTVATAPVNVTPRWRSRLKWPIVLGLAIFAYLLVRQVASILSTVF